MRVLRDTPSINTEIKENPDPAIANLLTRHLQFGAEFNPDDPADLLTVFIIEPGDTLQHHRRRDERLLPDQPLLRDDDSAIRAFVPCFETLEEHPTVYEMLFIQSDEGHALVMLIPKAPGIDPELLALCARVRDPCRGVVMRRGTDPPTSHLRVAFSFLETPMPSLIADLLDRLDTERRYEFEERAGTIEFDSGCHETRPRRSL